MEWLAAVTKVGALGLLGLALWQARRLASDFISNIDKFGEDFGGKRLAARRCEFNFYLAFCLVVILIAGLFDLLGRELFVALLVAALTALGMKITSEIRPSGK